MDFKSLTRNKEKVHEALKEDKNQLIAVKNVKIYIPEYLANAQLLTIGNQLKSVAVFLIVVDNHFYAVSTALAMMELTPDHSQVIDIEGVRYFELTFEKDSVICPNLNLVRIPVIVYRIYNLITAKGKIPFFFSYRDLALLYLTAKLHANVSLDGDLALFELLAAAMARQPTDKAKFYRHDDRLQSNPKFNDRPFFIALKSISYGLSNTFTKLAGGYFNEGVTSALANPAETNETIESLLRKK